MENFKEKEYKVFEMFDKQWAIVTAGSMEHYNSCTIGWGSLGNIWGHAGKSCPIVTVYVHPARYTSEFLENSYTFILRAAKRHWAIWVPILAGMVIKPLLQG